MTEKWIVDDCGTLINMETRENYDYMEEVVDVLNKLSKENEKLKCKVNGLKSELTIWKEDANEHIQETNKLFEENKQLKDKLSEYEKENENLNNVLEDFMVMLNRLQAEPNNKSLQIMARDMLRMMGKDIMGDSE